MTTLVQVVLSKERGKRLAGDVVDVDEVRAARMVELGLAAFPPAEEESPGPAETPPAEEESPGPAESPPAKGPQELGEKPKRRRPRARRKEG